MIGWFGVKSIFADQLPAKRLGASLQLPNPPRIRPEQCRLPLTPPHRIQQRPHLAFPIRPIATVTMSYAIGRDLLQQGLAQGAVQCLMPAS
ncbi:hypothetical protein [Pseudomonas baetica]|uniref:hypothetical protein n=1 Tax=Pseudomonas baetica TaxID=674054 RepID=UPI003D6634F3|nr:hypothetical protein [Pseudomonas baetica]